MLDRTSLPEKNINRKRTCMHIKNALELNMSITLCFMIFSFNYVVCDVAAIGSFSES